MILPPGGRSRPGPSRERGGQALSAGLFWILGGLLFVAPFLRDADRADRTYDDPVRATSEVDIPFDEDLAVLREELEFDLAEPLAAESEERFAADGEALAASGLVDVTRLEGGARNYDAHCAGCHGATGDGAGPAVRHLNPRPRNFRKGVFKFTSTESGRRPARADLFSTITRGLAGSSMPEFRLHSEEIRHDLVEFVRYLAIRGEFEQLALDLAWEEEELPDFDEVYEIVAHRWSERATRSVYPAIAETEDDEESVERGRALFLDETGANCASCHGEGGAGDGPAATDTLDDWGYPIRPRDLRTGTFRAGSSPADLYRSISTGINGTPMPAYGGAIEPEALWDLVHFVQSLSRGGAR